MPGAPPDPASHTTTKSCGSWFAVPVASRTITILYPRGRVDADNRGQPVIYMSPHVTPALLPEIQAAFAITSPPLLRYDNSRHYRCHLDDGWGVKGRGRVALPGSV